MDNKKNNMAKKKIKKIESADKAIERKFKDSLNIRYAKQPDIILLSTMKNKILADIDRRIKYLDNKLGKNTDFRKRNAQIIWWDNYGRYKSLISIRKLITKLK